MWRRTAWSSVLCMLHDAAWRKKIHTDWELGHQVEDLPDFTEKRWLYGKCSFFWASRSQRKKKESNFCQFHMASNWFLLFPWLLISKIDMTIYDMFCMFCMPEIRLLKRNVLKPLNSHLSCWQVWCGWNFLRSPSMLFLSAAEFKQRESKRLFWPFLFGDHAVLALFGSSVLGISDFPFSAGMQQWDHHRNHSGDCYGDHDNDHDYDHDNDDDVHGDHCRALSSNIDQQMGMPQLLPPKRGGFNSCKRAP